MRQNYPVHNEEMLTELRDIQESLISIIGYDNISFDNVIDVSGRLDVLEESIDSSNETLVNDRIYKEITPDYAALYRNSFVSYLSRRYVNDK